NLLKIGAGVPNLDLLAGAADTLWRLRPVLFVGTANEANFANVVDPVRAHGYRCWRMEASLFNSDNFNRRNDNIFGDRSELALLAIPEEVDVEMELPWCTEMLQ